MPILRTSKLSCAGFASRSDIPIRRWIGFENSQENLSHNASADRSQMLTCGEHLRFFEDVVPKRRGGAKLRFQFYFQSAVDRGHTWIEIGKHTSELQSLTNLACRLLLE